MSPFWREARQVKQIMIVLIIMLSTEDPENNI